MENELLAEMVDYVNGLSPEMFSLLKQAVDERTRATLGASSLTDEEVSVLREGGTGGTHILSVIRMVQRRTGLQLRDAKEFVERSPQYHLRGR